MSYALYVVSLLEAWWLTGRWDVLSCVLGAAGVLFLGRLRGSKKNPGTSLTEGERTTLAFEAGKGEGWKNGVAWAFNLRDDRVQQVERRLTTVAKAYREQAEDATCGYHDLFQRTLTMIDRLSSQPKSTTQEGQHAGGDQDDHQGDDWYNFNDEGVDPCSPDGHPLPEGEDNLSTYMDEVDAALGLKKA